MKILEEHIVMLKTEKTGAAFQRVFVIDAGERIVYMVKGSTNEYHREISKTEFDEANERGHEWLCPKWWRKQNKL